MKLKEWGAFALLGLIWGSSFLWIKIALEETGPFLLVTFRLLFGLAGLLVVMALQRQAWPRDRRVLLAFAFMGLVNTALPFTLITWGETLIDSSLAAILNGTVPLFSIVIGHFWLQDEKMTLPRLAGLLLGFVGMVVLVSGDLAPGALQGNVWGQLAVIAASISYAVAAIFSRKHLRGQPPVVQSTMVLLFASGMMMLTTPAVEQPLNLPDTALAWFAIVWLGLLGSCTAYLLFFYLLNAWGSTRTTLVTYVMPVMGLLLGIIFLNEAVDWRLIVGSALIVGGIVVVNLKVKPGVKRAVAASGAD